ncbi:MAG TPA: HRDC domain-containing protein [Polyangiaceae bacterium]|nr:HRDC domain-containing protein [Polyangiaceae bacterium]
MSSSPLLITRDEPFVALLERHARAREVALDCEFHGEKRYRPTLYLVQIGFAEEAVAVDPQRVDLRPLRAMLEDEAVRKVFHAGREDVRLLSRATGATDVPGIFDTQVAAAFLGHGLSIGYGRLVKELLGVELDKSNQFTDWSRELTSEQIDYALNDVRFLPRVTALLAADLERRGRLAWALDASHAMSRTALTEPDKRKLFRKISGSASLGAVELGTLRELAIWRDGIAESENCRPESVVSDAGLRQLALRPPAKQGQLRGMRGVGMGGSERWWASLREAVARGIADPEPVTPFAEQDLRAEAIAALLGVVRRVVATTNDVAAELLASSAELRALAEWQLGARKEPAPAIDALTGWRESLIGAPLLDALDGKVAVKVAAGTDAGLELVPG